MSARGKRVASPPETASIAASLARIGWPVFPVSIYEDESGKRHKVPAVKWKAEATTDVATVNAWWAGEHSGRWIGVYAGAAGIVTLDVDPGGDASLAAAGLAIPETLNYGTHRAGGRHHVYAAPEGVDLTIAAGLRHEGKPLEGIDVRSGAGLMVYYGPELTKAPKLAPAPDWLLVTGERAGSDRGERAPKRSDFLDEVRRRERDTWGRNAQPNDDARAIVEKTREMSPNIGHGELLDLAAELADVISSGAPGGAWAAGAMRSIYVENAPRGGDWGQAFDAALYGLDKLRLPLRTLRITKRERLAVEARKRAKAKKVKPGKPRNLRDLMALEFPPQNWVVAEMIPEGTSLVVSSPKVGKSLLALDVGLAAATGRDAFGSVPTGEARPVLYLDLESGERRLQSRVIAQGWNEFGRFAYHLDAATAVVTLERFMRKNRGRRPLVILDTLAAVMTDRGDKTQQYKHEYDSLKRLQTMTANDPGSAILIVHHTRKLESSDPLAMASGTHGTTGAVDHVFVLVRPDRMKPDGVLSRVSRDVENAEFELRLEDARWTAVGGSAEDAQQAHERREYERRLANLGPLKNGLLQVLEHASGATLSLDTIFERYEGASDRDTVGKALRSLSDAGFIEKVGRGAYMAGLVTK